MQSSDHSIICHFLKAGTQLQGLDINGWKNMFEKEICNNEKYLNCIEIAPHNENVERIISFEIYINNKYILHRENGPALIFSDGCKVWYSNGKKHREDGPAIKYPDGTEEWGLHNRRHRLDGPAVKRADGTKEWFLNGLRHRVDAPAIKRTDGSKEWYLNGQRHSVDSPAIERADGTKEWYLNGRRHRVDGPAIERADGTKEWYLNGERHRVGGPAIQRLGGECEWFRYDKRHRIFGPAILNYYDNHEEYYLFGMKHNFLFHAVKKEVDNKEIKEYYFLDKKIITSPVLILFLFIYTTCCIFGDFEFYIFLICVIYVLILHYILHKT